MDKHIGRDTKFEMARPFSCCTRYIRIRYSEGIRTEPSSKPNAGLNIYRKVYISLCGFINLKLPNMFLTLWKQLLTGIIIPAGILSVVLFFYNFTETVIKTCKSFS